jgi:hypothetical protein
MPQAPGHEVHVEDGRFTTAVCSCGWRGAGRRNRATARTEARDHALLYADGSQLADTSPPVGSDVDLTEHSVDADLSVEDRAGT